MQRSEADRQSESARAYLDAARDGTALQVTVELAAAVLGFPAAMVTILDASTQVTLAATGLDRPPPLPRRAALCDAVVTSGRTVVLEDMLTDPGPLPADQVGGFRAYAGVPLLGREGVAVGSLCLLDPEPRRVSPALLAQLSQFGAVVQEQLELLRRAAVVDGPALPGPRQLAEAIDLGQVVPWFQPVVELGTGRTVAYEALARWVHPEHGLLEPAAFVPPAEDSDVIVDLDLAVYTGALDALAGPLADDPALRVAVNLSGHQLAHPASLVRYRAAADAAGVAPHRITLELTETAALATGAREVEVIAGLREAGFQVVLDDFGTAWSSMDLLVRVPVDGIKIDRVMTAALGTTAGDAVVRASLELAAELGLSTVIEGVETREQARRAEALGGTHAQGFLYSPAVPASSLRTARAG